MHVVAIRRDLFERTWLAASVFDAFSRSKELAIWELEQTSFLRVTLPWVDLDEMRGLMCRDFLRVRARGEPGRTGGGTRWSFDEGLAERRLEPSELFRPSTVG